MSAHSERIHLQPIGFVETGVADVDIPRQRHSLVSDIVFHADYREALTGIEQWSHLIVLFYMHQVIPASGWLTHPRGRTDLAAVGVLAARGSTRPNPIGLAVVELLARADNRLTVKMLDARHGTPVLDVKPYDDYDVISNYRVPDWWRALTR